LAGDLDTIVAKALRKEPPRRYASAGELADDIRRHLGGLPVLARPDTLGYRVSKFAQRNRALVASLIVAFVALDVGLGVSLRASHVATRSRAEAEFLAYQSSIAAAESSIRTNRLDEARRQLESAPARFRGWEWEHLATRLDRSVLRIAAHDAEVAGVKFTAGGSRFVSTSGDSTLRVWDANTGAALARYGPLDGIPRSLSVNAAGSLAAVGLDEGRVRVIDLLSGAVVLSYATNDNWSLQRMGAQFEDDPQIALLDRASTWATVDFHPDGRRLGVGFFSGEIGTLDVDTQDARLWATEPLGYKRTVRFNPHRNLIAAASEVGPVQLWDTETRTLVRQLEGGAIGAVDVCFDPTGQRVAACFQDQSIQVWDVDSGRQIATLRGHAGSIRDIEFDASSELLVATATDGQLAAWEIATGKRRWVYPGPTVSSSCVDRSPDGLRLVSGDWSGTIRIWRFETQDVRTFEVQARGFRRYWAEDACLLDSERFVTAAIDRCLVWDLASTGNADEIDIPQRLERWMGKVLCVTTTRDANYIVAGMGNGWVMVLDPDSLRVVGAFPGHDGPVHTVDARPGQLQYVTGGRDSTLKLWEVGSEQPLRVLHGHHGGVLATRYSPGGDRIASGSADGSIRIWDADTGELDRTLHGHHDAVRRVAFSRDGSLLASASFDGTVRLWDMRTTAAIATLVETGQRMYAVAFGPDGQRLAAGGADGVVRILDPTARREVARLHGHDDRIWWLGFTEDRSLISTSLDGTIRVWDAAAP
jgi:WD40 repeat protein